MKVYHYFRHKLLECLYVLIVVVLLTVAIYSVYYVLYDYLYDNTMTSVQMETTDNILPFIQYLTVVYFIRSVNGTKSVIPQTWNMTNKEIEAENLFPSPNGMAAIERIANRKNNASFYLQNSTDLSLDSQCDITTIAEMIGIMDNNFWLSGKAISESLILLDDNQYNDDQPQNINFSDAVQLLRSSYYNVNQSIKSDLNTKLLSVIDSFIDNSYGNELVDKVLSKLTPFKYARFDVNGQNEFLDLPMLYLNDQLTHQQVGVSIPMDFFSNRTGDRLRKWPIQIGFLPQTIITKQVNVQLSISPLFEPGSIFNNLKFDFLKFKTFQYDITVKNFGIYNTSDVRDDCDVCGNFTLVEDCVYKCKLDTAVDVCGCIPFGFRRWYRDDSNRNQLPFCTSERYAKCSKSDKFNSSHCTFDKFKPCIVTRNNYDIQISYQDNPPSINDTPKLVYRFTFEEKTYVVYQDQYQNSFMEMLGQLGGNLGVFLGFSLLGVWQFFIFMHMTYNRHCERKRQKSMAAANQASNFVLPWLRMAQLTVERDAIEIIPAKQQLSRDHSQEMLQAAEIRIETLRLNMAENSQKAKEEIDQLKFINITLESRLQALEERLTKKEEVTRL